MGGQEDADGAEVFPEMTWAWEAPPLAEHLPIGFSDPAAYNPDILMHTPQPTELDALGRPVLYSAENLMPDYDIPEEDYHPG
jgi:hypothetical protein